MITSNDPTQEIVFLLPSAKSIAGYDDDQLNRSMGRARLERIKSYQRYTAIRLTAVFMGAVTVIAVSAATGVYPPIKSNLALTVATVFVVLVFAAAVVVAITKRNEERAWNEAAHRIETEIQRRRGDTR